MNIVKVIVWLPWTVFALDKLLLGTLPHEDMVLDHKNIFPIIVHRNSKHQICLKIPDETFVTVTMTLLLVGYTYIFS